jgi:hypothetical protein
MYEAQTFPSRDTHAARNLLGHTITGRFPGLGDFAGVPTFDSCRLWEGLGRAQAAQQETKAPMWQAGVMRKHRHAPPPLFEPLRAPLPVTLKYGYLPHGLGDIGGASGFDSSCSFRLVDLNTPRTCQHLRSVFCSSTHTRRACPRRGGLVGPADRRSTELKDKLHRAPDPREMPDPQDPHSGLRGEHCVFA